jgi:hypothetical protein
MPTAIVTAVAPANYEVHQVDGKARWVLGGVLQSLRRSTRLTRCVVYVIAQECVRPVETLWQSLATVENINPPLLDVVVVDPLELVEKTESMVNLFDDDEIVIEVSDMACYLSWEDVDETIRICQDEADIVYLGYKTAGIIVVNDGRLAGPNTVYTVGTLKTAKAKILKMKELEFRVSVHEPKYFLAAFRYNSPGAVSYVHQRVEASGSWPGMDYKVDEELPPGVCKDAYAAAIAMLQKTFIDMKEKAEAELKAQEATEERGPGIIRPGQTDVTGLGGSGKRFTDG